MAKKGQLLFKGEKPKPHKKKKRQRDEGDTDADNNSNNNNNQAKKQKGAVDVNLEEGETDLQPQTVVHSNTVAATKSTSTTSSTTPSIRKGTGLITTSGTVATGHETKFEKEISIGDALLVIINGNEELRVVTMRLSDTSLNLSSGFSESIKIPQGFQYIKKPKDTRKEQYDIMKQQIQSATEREKNVYDLYRNDTVVYREKTETGSYRIKQQKLKEKDNITRAALLDWRSKKTSDKYC